jgi:hypothetical protein
MSEYNVGRFDVALDDATNAYLLDPRPGLLYNIGQCQRALHNWERAEFFYRGYLRDKPDATNRKAVEDLIADMQAKQKEEAAAKTAEASAKPAPVETPILVEAPAASTTAPAAPPPRHGHGLAIGLGSAAVALLAFTVVSIVVVEDYNSSYVGPANASPGTLAFPKEAAGTAGIFEITEWVAGGLALAGFTSAALTW